MVKCGSLLITTNCSIQQLWHLRRHRVAFLYRSSRLWLSRPPAQVPCCPATVQLITKSQKVTQLQQKPKEQPHPQSNFQCGDVNERMGKSLLVCFSVFLLTASNVVKVCYCASAYTQNNPVLTAQWCTLNSQVLLELERYTEYKV